MNLFDVKDRVIVITGATGILGRAMVRHFADEGAKVVILGRNEQVGNQLADEAVKAGGTAVFYTTNVLDKERLEQNYADIMERFGRIDVLINGAGGNMPGATIAPSLRNGFTNDDFCPCHGGAEAGLNYQYCFRSRITSAYTGGRLWSSESGCH